MEIKLPATWLVSKGIKISPDDDWYNGGYEKVSPKTASFLNFGSCISGFITSFAWRVGSNGSTQRVPIELMRCPPQAAAKWKPDAKALMEMYTAEQRAIEIDELNKQIAPEPSDSRSEYWELVKNPLLPILKKYNATDIDNTANVYGVEQPTMVSDAIKKETKLKLTKDDVGKKFEIGSGSVFKSLYFKNEQSVLEGPVGDLHVCDSYGYMDSLSVSIIKRHEPRYWLKDLPDADAFSESVSCIACNSKGWYVSRGSMMGHFITNKMPELTPNDYDSSEMAIMDLRVWQRENK